MPLKPLLERAKSSMMRANALSSSTMSSVAIAGLRAHRDRRPRSSLAVPCRSAAIGRAFALRRRLHAATADDRRFGVDAATLASSSVIKRARVRSAGATGTKVMRQVERESCFRAHARRC